MNGESHARRLQHPCIISQWPSYALPIPPLIDSLEHCFYVSFPVIGGESAILSLRQIVGTYRNKLPNIITKLRSCRISEYDSRRLRCKFLIITWVGSTEYTQDVTKHTLSSIETCHETFCDEVNVCNIDVSDASVVSILLRRSSTFKTAP